MPLTYAIAETQIIFAGHLLEGMAADWYYSLVDLATFRVPPTYTLLSFLHELEDFFGGGVTLQNLERSLITVRQTGTVSELAIQFQSITDAFRPRWPDHPLIFEFAQKLKEVIRFELTSRGTPPPTFQAYIAAAISMEQN